MEIRQNGPFENWITAVMVPSPATPDRCDGHRSRMGEGSNPSAATNESPYSSTPRGRDSRATCDMGARADGLLSGRADAGTAYEPAPTPQEDGSGSTPQRGTHRVTSNTQRKERDVFTIAELEILIEGVGTLISEYGDRPERVALLERLRAERAARYEEAGRLVGR